MKSWGIRINTIYKTAHYHFDEANSFFFILKSLIQRICDIIPSIPLLRGYKLNDLFHLCICSPIVDWCWTHIRVIFIKANYDEVLKKFPKEFDFICDLKEQVNEKMDEAK